MSDRQDSAARVRQVVVGDGEDGQRLDNFLLARCSGVPKSHIYRVIRSGEVRINSGRTKPMQKLRTGDKVRIPPMRLKAEKNVKVPGDLSDAIAALVVHEHSDFLIVAKPPGLAVHKGSGLMFGAIDALRQALDQNELELVHRLDRGTSGALLVARDRGRCRSLQALFREQQVKKSYLALVAGHWPKQASTVDVPLRKNVATAGERRVVVDPDGQAAVSHFRIKTQFEDATMMDVNIETGRTHQIRVHALHCGHPLIGDSRYGNNATNAEYKRRGLGRLFLHAHKLAFNWKDEAYNFEVPVDNAWNESVANLN